SVRDAEPLGHQVQHAAQQTQLVARSHPHPGGKLALDDAPRELYQLADGPGDVTSHEHAGNEGQDGSRRRVQQDAPPRSVALGEIDVGAKIDVQRSDRLARAGLHACAASAARSGRGLLRLTRGGRPPPSPRPRRKPGGIWGASRYSSPTGTRPLLTTAKRAIAPLTSVNVYTASPSRFVSWMRASWARRRS